MDTNTLPHLLDQAVEVAGPQRVADALRVLADIEVANDSAVLTLVANAGVHAIPDAFLRGEVYAVSHGDWLADTRVDLEAELIAILKRLVHKLRSQRWNRIYLIPTGHPVLTVNVKLLVYRILRLNTIDLYYRSGQYIDVHIDHRRLALAADDND